MLASPPSSVDEALAHLNSLSPGFEVDLDSVLLARWTALDTAFHSLATPTTEPFQLWALRPVHAKLLVAVCGIVFADELAIDKHSPISRRLHYGLSSVAKQLDLHSAVVCFVFCTDVALNLNCIKALQALHATQPDLTLVDITDRFLAQAAPSDSNHASRGRGRRFSSASSANFRIALGSYAPGLRPKRKPKAAAPSRSEIPSEEPPFVHESRSPASPASPASEPASETDMQDHQFQHEDASFPLDDRIHSSDDEDDLPAAAKQSLSPIGTPFLKHRVFHKKPVSELSPISERTEHPINTPDPEHARPEHARPRARPFS
ncbi:hypothetical protein ColLi_12701 [Colletotrichum liriopes]|uniref:Uncharacterized protein n=1 Tax=Colletotrichum liriopes TaxID=708192 RepID=A0AA37LZX2_9PEZI|nr:hypothetical protein ColLi_12701 [Colletotrichum liriopes]